ncbi:MAG: response regulator [Bacteroidota bacterium]
MEKKVFLVDDDRDDREIFIEALAEVDNSFFCVTAESGEEALKELHTTSIVPNYIFLDLNMPRMNGRECLVEIKSIERLKEIPIIIYTTSSLQKERDELVKLGASMFITKPANFTDLCLSLKKIMFNSVSSDSLLSPA